MHASDRRTFLQSLAAAGTGAVLRAAGTSARPHRIDIHHHLFPPS